MKAEVKEENSSTELFKLLIILESSNTIIKFRFPNNTTKLFSSATQFGKKQQHILTYPINLGL